MQPYSLPVRSASILQPVKSVFGSLAVQKLGLRAAANGAAARVRAARHRGRARGSLTARARHVH